MNQDYLNSNGKLLAYFYQYPNATIRSAAQRLGMTDRGVSGILKRLMASGAIRSEPYPTNKRQTRKVVIDQQKGAEVAQVSGRRLDTGLG